MLPCSPLSPILILFCPQVSKCRAGDKDSGHVTYWRREGNRARKRGAEQGCVVRDPLTWAFPSGCSGAKLLTLTCPAMDREVGFLFLHVYSPWQPRGWGHLLLILGGGRGHRARWGTVTACEGVWNTKTLMFCILRPLLRPIDKWDFIKSICEVTTNLQSSWLKLEKRQEAGNESLLFSYLAAKLTDAQAQAAARHGMRWKIRPHDGSSRI